MPPLKEVSSSRSPEELLREALRAEDPASRIRLAEAGLEAGAGAVAPDTEVLLLRQIYLAHLESHRFQTAAEVARRAARLGPLADIAHHDASRALAAMGDLEAACAEQRLAVRVSPAERRSFHGWSLGTLLHQAGHHEAAIAAFRRGERWANEDRPLLRAHRAWVRLEAGQPVRHLAAIIAELERSKKASQGYGQLVLGMLRHRMGDDRAAAVHLRAFLRRNAAADPAKAVTLRHELRQARTVLAAIESE